MADLILIKDTFKEDKINAQRRQEEICSEVSAKGSQLNGTRANVTVAPGVLKKNQNIASLRMSIVSLPIKSYLGYMYI